MEQERCPLAHHFQAERCYPPGRCPPERRFLRARPTFAVPAFRAFRWLHAGCKLLGAAAFHALGLHFVFQCIDASLRLVAKFLLRIRATVASSPRGDIGCCV